MKKGRKLLVAELVGYIISGLLGLAGLTLSILGIIGANLKDLNNPLRNASDKLEAAIKLGFQPFGAIILILGVVIAVIILTSVGRKIDVEEEKKARRAQRFSLESDAKNGVTN